MKPEENQNQDPTTLHTGDEVYVMSPEPSGNDPVQPGSQPVQPTLNSSDNPVPNTSPYPAMPQLRQIATENNSVAPQPNQALPVEMNETANFEKSAPRVDPDFFLIRFFKDKRTWIGGGILFAILFLVVIFQLSYSSDRLAYDIQIDGIEVGGMRKSDAANLLSQAYGESELEIFLGENKQVFKTAKIKDIGVNTKHEERLAPIEYPWYFRIIPTSIFWIGAPKDLEAPSVEYDAQKANEYVSSQLGNDCKVNPKGATLGIERTYLAVIPSVEGGICDKEKVSRLFQSIKPSLDETQTVRVETIPIKPIITNEIAKKVADTLNKRFELPMPIMVADVQDKVAREEVLSWLDFTPQIPKPGSGPEVLPTIVYSVDDQLMEKYLVSTRVVRKLTVDPTPNKVSTTDFTVTSSKDGKAGVGVDIGATANLVDGYIAKTNDMVKIVTKVVNQTTDFSRKYTPSDEGFKAMLHQFAFDNVGIRSASFFELKKADARSKARKADFVGDKILPAEGIENIFIAFATRVAVVTNKTYWNERVLDSLTVQNCYDRVVKNNDLSCRNALLKRLTFAYVENLARESGLTHTTFAGIAPTTTANDLLLFISKVSDEAYGYKVGNELINDMKETSQRDGIRKGVGVKNDASNAVGVGSSVINEAVFVNSTENGDYVLVVMTDGSNWSTIEKLGKLVQELHARKE